MPLKQRRNRAALDGLDALGPCNRNPFGYDILNQSMISEPNARQP